MSETPMAPGDAAFPPHVYGALGAPPQMMSERIGGAVGVVEKRPANGPITLITIGTSRLTSGPGEQVELAVEVLEGQQGAGLVALRIVCDDMATNHRVPPVGVPWRNLTPFLGGTAISAIMVTSSRWGEPFDDVRSADGSLVGHIRTLRLLTDPEAAFANAQGWDALVRQTGSIDALLDVTRTPTVAEQQERQMGNEHLNQMPVILSKLHYQHPPRWVSFVDNYFTSVTGFETPEYMEAYSWV